jgi:manganese efflux pump family protein
MLALLLVAVSVGMSNFAAAIAIGVSGVDARTRLRVGLIFGAFESGMPVVGLLIGARVAAPLGHAARWVAAGLLVAVGCYTLISAAAGLGRASEAGGAGPARLGPLLLAGLALSLDNLAAGFALGGYHTPVVAGAVIIGAVSVALALAGLELGSRIGSRAGEWGERLAGLLLIGVGAAIAAGALS